MKAHDFNSTSMDGNGSQETVNNQHADSPDVIGNILKEEGISLTEDKLEQPSEDSSSAKEEPKEVKEEDVDLSPQEILKKLEEEKSEDQSDVEQPQANAEDSKEFMEIDGQKYSKQEIQDGFMMRKDYTQKTQELSDQRKLFEQEATQVEQNLTEKYNAVEEREKQLVEQTQGYQQWDFFLQNLKANDPDFHAEIQSRFQNANQHLNNPVVQQLQQQVNNLTTQLQTNSNQAENQVILDSYNKELSSLKEKVVPRFNVLGLKNVDYDKIQKVWTEGEGNKLTVEDAFFAVHGKDIQKLYSSKLKLDALKEKQANKNKVVDIGSVNKGISAIDEIKTDLRGKSNSEIVQAVIGNL